MLYQISKASQYSVAGINYVMRYIVVGLVRRISYKTFTKETRNIMLYVFLIQILNTGPLLLLVNADLSEAKIPILSSIFTGGMHRDFTLKWYEDVGKIIMNAMIYQIYWPFIDFLMWLTYRWVLRLWDKRWCCCKKWRTTRSKTIYEYIEIYAGPEYQIHYKYSTILNTVYITFMFGAGMPILFPIALAQFFVLYMWERLLLLFSYRQPLVMHDEKLSKHAIRILSYSPIIYCIFGYWMYDNEQLMGNYKLIPTDTFGESMRTGHSLWESITAPSKQSMMFYPGIFILLLN
jgi:hypothetical protein